MTTPHMMASAPDDQEPEPPTDVDHEAEALALVAAAMKDPDVDTLAVAQVFATLAIAQAIRERS